MRSAVDAETIPKELKQYSWEFFRQTELNQDMLKSLAIFVADGTYRAIANLGVKDKYTWSYFSTVVPALWDALQDRGVDVFYIIDNEMREDRFELAVELFELSGVAVVTPYKDVKSYDDVEKKFNEFMRSTRNIIYIEKDDSVNYIEKVKDFARQSKYFAFFRNQDVSNPDIEILGQ